MKYTFEQAMACCDILTIRECEKAAKNKELFEKAKIWMKSQSFVANIAQGSLSGKNGILSQFVSYDWIEFYIEHPEWVFFDYFKPVLMNKYDRLLRGVDK